MIMIIGGAFSGKSAYARERFPIPFVRAEDAGREDLFSLPGVLNLEGFLRRELLAGQSLAGFAEELYARNPSLVFTVQEVGCGIVPLDAFERRYRETVGRISTALAARSEEVIRLYAGIPVRIKPGEAPEGGEG